MFFSFNLQKQQLLKPLVSSFFTTTNVPRIQLPTPQ